MPKLIPSLILGAAIAVAPASAIARDTPEVQLARLLEGRVAGQPTDCISLTSARSSHVIPGKAIVYEVGGRLYVNEPRSGASSLRDDDLLVTRTIGSQLCRLDSVNLVDRTARFPRGFVTLGQFVPYSKVKAEAR
ncbi:hypothetical protein FHS95_002637 [Sphingomonas naasensis]|uniref:Uncharacterized protein n=1 Tax=Sphingomonas naasensis TaxID=1344951 RepID=A0A4S1WJF6_9SPHN|nr:hypothetical protein [Sphingomonas naasensis]NIJ20945.1 hypothetical protein [Sphingomonas naasensis]TGX43331.1 hypothetical protein E5A74_09215 [Sphingomonas naasensis]